MDVPTKNANERFVEVLEYTKQAMQRCMELEPAGRSIGYRISVGLLVKMYKLFASVIRNSSANDGLAALILLRVYYETSISLRYLLVNYEKELFLEFVLTDDMRTRDLIETYRRSSMFDTPGRERIRQELIEHLLQDLSDPKEDIASLPKGYPKSWHRELSYAKMAESLEQASSSGTFKIAYGRISKFVHPSWVDIRQNHLRLADVLPKSGEPYEPNLATHSTPSREWNMLICFGLDTCDAYARRFGGSQKFIDEINQTHASFHQQFDATWWQ